MYRFRYALGAAAAAAAAKAAALTLNDDWDDVLYSVGKLPGRLFGAGPKRKPRVVVLGSGWGALTFIQKLDQEEVDLTIVSPRSFFFYTPLLAGTATGTVGHGSIVEPIRWYCERTGHARASYLQAECTSIDPAAKRLTCTVPSQLSTDTPPTSLALDYDYLVISVGAQPMTFNIPGVRENARFIKEVEDSVAIQRDLLQKLEVASALQAAAEAEGASAEHRAALEAQVGRLLSWVVIGGGPTGVELTAELTDFVRQEVVRYFPALAPRVRITLVEAADRVLGVFDKALSASAAATLTRLGASVQCNTAVTRITPEAVEYRATDRGASPPLVTTGALPQGVCVWAGGITRRPVVEAFAQRLDPGGQHQTSRHGLLVDAWMRVKGAPDHSVFALGDCAVSGCPPTAQAAVAQGRFLGKAFRDALPAVSGQADPSRPSSSSGLAPLAPFAFTSKGALAYTGGGSGVAELKGLWNAHPGKAKAGGATAGAAGAAGDSVRVDGTPAFALWRSLYFSSILSTSNQARVAFDWLKTSLSGRDISSPFVEGLFGRDKGPAPSK